MAQIEIRTLGTISLRGPDGEIPLEGPRLAALIALLAIAGDAGMSDDELILRLTPNATTTRGRAELTRLIDVARHALGDGAITRLTGGFAFTNGFITLDVCVLAHNRPTELTEFLAGFTLPDSPEFSEWLSQTRRRVEPMSTRSAREGTKRRRLLLGIAAAMVLVMSTAYFASARSAGAFKRGDPLLVADISNETGDAMVSRGLASATIVGLQQSGRLRLYPRGRLPEIYRLMQIANRDTALTFELAQEVAQRDGVRFVLGVHVERAGDGFRLTGKLADVAAEKILMTATATATTRDALLTALDTVLLETRRRLGESPSEMADRRTPLPLVTTSSLEALSSYADGGRAWDKGDYRLANELWRRAIDLDTGFAMAYGALGQWHYQTNNREQGEHYFTEAFKRAGRLTEREYLRLRESAATYRGQTDSAVAITGLLASRFPSVATWYNHGTDLMTARRDSEAIVAFKTALGYDAKHVNSNINLATVSGRLSRWDDALRYYTRAGELDSTALYRGFINLEYGSALVMLGRLADAESVFTRMARRPQIESRASGLRSLGYLAFWRGRGDDAADFFRQATEASVQIRAPLTELRNRMLLATTYREMGRDAEANDEITKAITLARAAAIEPTPLSWVVNLAVKSGRVADARAVSTLLQSRVNPTNAADVAASAYVRSLLALAEQQPDSALRLARAAAQFLSPILRAVLEAEAYRELGQLDSARAAIERIRKQKAFGYESQDEWMRAPIVLGDLRLAQHDTAGALREYEQVLEQMRGAPPGMRSMAEAQTRIDMVRRSLGVTRN
jgi:Tfp pilus assembly protein PilF/TolB-like protein